MDESLRCAVLEDLPNSMLCLAFCVPCALRFIPFADLFSASLTQHSASISAREALKAFQQIAKATLSQSLFKTIE